MFEAHERRDDERALSQQEALKEGLNDVSIAIQENGKALMGSIKTVEKVATDTHTEAKNTNGRVTKLELAKASQDGAYKWIGWMTPIICTAMLMVLGWISVTIFKMNGDIQHLKDTLGMYDVQVVK